MGNGIKLGPRATILLVVLLAASAVGILTPTLSNTVSRDGGPSEGPPPQPGGMDPKHGLLGAVRRVWRRAPGRLPGGGPTAIARELHLHALGRATGWPRDPRPPHLHLRAALSGPTFIFPIRWK